MKVKIISSNDKDNWYNHRIGEIFDVKGPSMVNSSFDISNRRYDLYQVIVDTSSIYYIYKNDCIDISIHRQKIIEELLNEG